MLFMPTRQPNDPPLTINRLAEETGQDRRTIRKRLVDAGLFPPDKHPREKVIAAVKPVQGAQSIKEKIQLETWRKLKIANDVKEGRLQSADKEAEWLGSVLSGAREVLEQKLVNELPALVENLDAPQIRVRAKKLFDDVLLKLQPLGQRFSK